MIKPIADTKQAVRSLWQPNGHRRNYHSDKMQAPAAKIHMLEESYTEADFDAEYEAALTNVPTTEADNLDADMDEMHAIIGEPAERNLCFSKLIKGTCNKPDCPHKHDKAAIDAMARAILARPN